MGECSWNYSLVTHKDTIGSVARSGMKFHEKCMITQKPFKCLYLEWIWRINKIIFTSYSLRTKVNIMIKLSPLTPIILPKKAIQRWCMITRMYDYTKCIFPEAEWLDDRATWGQFYTLCGKMPTGMIDKWTRLSYKLSFLYWQKVSDKH